MNPLIDIDEFVKIKDRPDVKVFDLRGDWGTPPASKHEAYLAGHIPGAVLYRLDHGFSGRKRKRFSRSGRGLCKDQRVRPQARHQQRRQLSSSTTITIICSRARTRWALRYWGHPDVRILNGGWKQWQASGRGTATGDELPQQPGNFEASEQPERIISTERVRQVVREAARTAVPATEQPYLIDARGPVGYGNGHIAGAINLPFSDIADKETDLFKSDAEIARIFDEKIPDWKSKPIIASCGAGYAATIVVAALEKRGRAEPAVRRLLFGVLPELNEQSVGREPVGLSATDSPPGS